MQYKDLSEIVHVVKVVAIVTSVHLNLSKILVVSQFLSAHMSPERRLNPCFRTQKKCPFPLNKRGSSTQRLWGRFSVTTFSDPWTEVSLE